jgi:hypothetical protein
MTWEPCVTCARVSKCGDVDHNLLLEGGGCSLHEPAHEGIVRARLRIMDEFGALAIPTKKNLKDGVITMAGTVSSTAASKRNLRALGKVLGVVPKGGASFKLSAEEICTMIKESGDPRFINLEKMSDEEVAAITEELGGEEGGEETGAAAPAPTPAPAAPAAKKPAAPAPAARASARSKPEPEPEAEEEAEAPAPRAPQRPAPAPVAPLRPDAKRPAAPVRPAAPAASAPTSGLSADLSKLEEMVMVIGKAGDARDLALKNIITTLNQLAEKVEAIDAHLAYQYNASVEPGNEIKSLTEVSWI